jgi:hypothetical protein
MFTPKTPQHNLHTAPQKKRPASYLNFELLEDVMGLPLSERDAVLSQAATFRIGPLVEYAYHEYGDADRCLRTWSGDQTVRAFAKALDLSGVMSASADSSLQAKQVEFFRSPRANLEYEEGRWIAFCRRLEDAGIKAGLSKGFSQGLAGTFGEMTSNILEHSESPGTGIVGYSWREREFEYVVADAGIGVFESLRKHPDYDWLVDSGQALETAVQDGESRFGHKGGRGTGFHLLLCNIADRNSYLRFRSGDHSYVLDGTHGTPRKEIRPCAPFQGFLISIVCQAPMLSLT